MKSLGDHIRTGLNVWVGQGVTPPQLAHRIVAQVRLVGPRPWWRTWQGSAGIAVAAAALLVASVGNQLDSLTEVLGRPQFELHLSAAPVREQLINRPIQVIEPKGSIQFRDQGVNLSLDKVELYSDSTRVTYSLNGISVDRQSEPEAYQPVLTADGHAVVLQSFSALQISSGVRFVARFGHIKPGQTLTLTVNQLPLPVAEQMEWRSTGVDLSGPVKITEWRQQSRRADVTVQWSEEFAHRLVEWTVVDISGKTYSVTESLPVTVNGVRVQQLQLTVPQGVTPVILRVGGVERNTPGLWQVSVHTKS